ncbi:MAG: YkgJ family cysteine cluster protein [Phycisphaerales bacterium]
MSYQPARDWFDSTDPTGAGRGLRFECTCCGNCCTGPEGFVLFTEAEAGKLAARLGVSREEFERRYTKETARGRSLAEKPSAFGLDCIFLDRESVPGKAVCGVYGDRPAQCRTWPFWKGNIRSEQAWAAAARNCPGINRGRLIPPEQVRILRDAVDI